MLTPDELERDHGAGVHRCRAPQAHARPSNARHRPSMAHASRISVAIANTSNSLPPPVQIPAASASAGMNSAATAARDGKVVCRR